MHGLSSLLFGKMTGRTRIQYGTSFPLQPKVGELFYRTDETKMYIFIGVGEPGTTSGWFNLKNAQYAA
jgi:hypothetical protein